jgi:acetylornithine deacetylase
MQLDTKSILEKLVSFKVFGGDSNLEIVHWIRDYLISVGVEPHLLYNEAKDKALLHCRIGPATDGGVVLSGHMDVVPVEGQDWSSDPFVLTEKDERLYARGSCDMKGFIAICLSLVPEMQRANLQRPIYFAFSYDEEIGCMAGDLMAQTIKSTYKESIPFAIIGEPTMMRPTLGQKGICFYQTIVKGSEGHSSRILEEVSAIHESVKLITWLENKMLSLGDLNVDNRFNPPQSTIHVGKIKAGIATNVVADNCKFFWDVRTIPSDNIEEIINEFDVFCKGRKDLLQQKFPGFDIITIEEHPPVPALDTASTSEVLKLLRTIGISGKEQSVSYAAEAGQFARNGFEAIICGPGSIAQAHRADEFIDLEQIREGEQMIKNLIQHLR